MKNEALFPEEPMSDATLRKALDRMSAEPPDAHRWPKALAEMVSVAQAALKHAGARDADAQRYAEVVMMALGHHMGGAMFYLPRGDALKRALRDIEIYRDYDGHNVPELARRYGLGLHAVYRIIADQHLAHSRRSQPGLFQEEAQR